MYRIASPAPVPSPVPSPVPTSRRRSRGRRIAVAVVAALLIGLVLPAGAASAAAYRYWGYFQWDGSAWQFASKGPGQVKPADGSVEGWRFATAGEDSTRFPRAEVGFDEVCGGTDVEDGQKRVAVVIDYGRAADTEDGSTPPDPVAECASVDEAATSLEVLGSVADVRTDKQLVCGVDGHPASGCGGEVKSVSPEAQAADEPVEVTIAGQESADGADTRAADASEDDGTSTGTWLGIGVVVLVAAALAVAALVRRRRA